VFSNRCRPTFQRCVLPSSSWSDHVSELRPLMGISFDPPDDSVSMEIHSGLTLTGINRRSRRKVCPSATLSTTNSTWTDPGVHDEWTATNRLSHGTALENGLFWCVESQ
jgi:hypothetical protein